MRRVGWEYVFSVVRTHRGTAVTYIAERLMMEDGRRSRHENEITCVRAVHNRCICCITPPSLLSLRHHCYHSTITAITLPSLLSLCRHSLPTEFQHNIASCNIHFFKTRITQIWPIMFIIHSRLGKNVWCCASVRVLKSLVKSPVV